jgi:aryl-alcohol dehydrogenase-like predicted oxidoreductase
MEQRRLGKTGMTVSEICMGTMTFGLQTEEAEAHRILDRCHAAGIDFYDTAEVYPVPPVAELVGKTEEIFGRWMKGKPRDGIILATKVTGAAHGWFNAPVRNGKCALDRRHIRQAVEGSLRRLQTDYIDLYQVHWPDHGMRAEDTLEPLHELVQEGKVRSIGCSNQNSFGLMKSLWASDLQGISRYETIQNNFSLNNRRFEDELAEICRREQVSLLPYSPLAGGVLSGKYNRPDSPKDARFSEYLKSHSPRHQAMVQRFLNERCVTSTGKFLEVARAAGLHPVTMAAAWSKQHDFVAATIVGVSREDQLGPILAAAGLKLDADTLAAIDAVSREILYPMG